MVALLHPTHLHPTPTPRSAAQPRHLRLVQTEAKSSADPLSVIAVVAIMATVLLVVLVRGVQGAPPASDWQTLGEASVQNSAVAASVGAGLTITVVEGDTWATIAARVDPGADPVEFARSLAAVNGGYQLQVGQVLILPAAD
jgi:hypothetical protein